MQFEPLSLEGAFRIRLARNADDRGAFVRTFCADTFASHGLESNFVQQSISFNIRRGTVRGLHLQAPPDVETKTVRCARGSAFDVLVDLRSGSPTFGRSHYEELDASSLTVLYVPRGLAHGFQTLEDYTELQYSITPSYASHAARGVRFDDPKLAIPWPLPVTAISERDRMLPELADLRGEWT